jgi:hypothetical protein
MVANRIKAVENKKAAKGNAAARERGNAAISGAERRSRNTRLRMRFQLRLVEAHRKPSG